MVLCLDTLNSATEATPLDEGKKELLLELCDAVAKAKGRCEAAKVLGQALEGLNTEVRQAAADKLAKLAEEKEAERASNTSAKLQELEDEAAATDPPGAVEDNVKQMVEAEFAYAKARDVLQE